MSVTVFWVRHGAHGQLGRTLSGRTPGLTLAEEGLAQARAVARRLEGEGLECVFTSPMERCRQTAEPIAALTGRPAQVVDGINEIDFGAWSGGAFPTLDQDPGFVRWNTSRDAVCCPDGESMFEVQARVLRWMEGVAATGARAVAAVSHADVIKAAVMLALGLSPRAHDRLEVSPGSVTTIVGSEWGYRLLSLNETPR